MLLAGTFWFAPDPTGLFNTADDRTAIMLLDLPQ